MERVEVQKEALPNQYQFLKIVSIVGLVLLFAILKKRLDSI